MKKAILPLIILTSLLASCGSQNAIQTSNQTSIEQNDTYRTSLIRSGDTQIVQLMDDLGGRTELIKFLANSSDEEISQKLAKYNINYTVSKDNTFTAQGTPTCPDHLPFILGGMRREGPVIMFADSFGRPSMSLINLDKTYPAAAQSSCQQVVADMGYKEHPQYNWQGGHLVPRSLGGPSTRANLVPQIGNLNQGFMARGDKILNGCRKSPYKTTWSNTVEYENNTTLVPDGFHIEVVWSGGPVLAYSREIANSLNGGYNGQAYATEFAVAARAEGCVFI